MTDTTRSSATNPKTHYLMPLSCTSAQVGNEILYQQSDKCIQREYE